MENADAKIRKEKILLKDQGIGNKSTKNYDDYMIRIRENIRLSVKFSTVQQSNELEEPSSKKSKYDNDHNDDTVHG